MAWPETTLQFQPYDFRHAFLISTLCLGFAAGHWVALWHYQYFWWDRIAEWVQIWLHSYNGSHEDLSTETCQRSLPPSMFQLYGAGSDHTVLASSYTQKSA